MKTILMTIILLSAALQPLTGAANTVKNAKKHLSLQANQSHQSETAKIVEINATNHEKVLGENPLLIIDVYTDTCGPCKRFSPIFAQANKELGHEYCFSKLNAGKEKKLSHHYNVHAVPTVIFIKNGKELGRFSGLMTKDHLIQVARTYFNR